MITEDYVSFETAKLLKEEGFDEECDCFYNNTIDYGTPGLEVDGQLYYKNSALYDEEYAAPTLQMAMKWLREEKKIGIEINTNFDCADGKWYYEYGFCIFQLYGTFEKLSECDYDGYKTYEEACEAAIKYCLKNLI